MISLEETKLHLRVDTDDEDDPIQGWIDAAELHVANYLNAPTGELAGLFPAAVPATVRAAVLLLVGDLYTNRESQSDRQLYLNDTFRRLLDPYRVMST